MKKAEKIANDLIANYEDLFANAFHKMMKNKLGMISDEDQDKRMMTDLFKLMHKNQADYTNTFRYLINGKFPQEKLLNDPDFIIWEAEWKKRLSKNQNSEDAYKLMIKYNPCLFQEIIKLKKLYLKQKREIFLSFCYYVKL